MDSKNVFGKYRNRLVAEGVLKSLILGLLVGFAVNIVVATVSCFVDFNGLWISIGLWFGCTLVSAPIFYFAKFRPTTKQIAARVDRLGLEERVITMLELEKNESYIAMRQREDAKSALAATNKKIKFNIFTAAFMKPALVAGLSVAFVLSASATTMAGLKAYGVIDRSQESVMQYTIKYGIKDALYPQDEKNDTNANVPAAKKLSVDKTVGEDKAKETALQGHINGLTEQKVEEGTTTTVVVAVASEDWVFVGWSDGHTRADRTDVAEGGDREIYAIFEEKPVDSDDTEVGDSLSMNNNSDSNQTGNPGEPGDEKYKDPNNQVIDGKTNYQEIYEQYYKEAMEILANGGEIPAYLQKRVEAYLNMLK